MAGSRPPLKHHSSAAPGMAPTQTTSRGEQALSAFVGGRRLGGRCVAISTEGHFVSVSSTVTARLRK
ncbi:hypothetical protein F751_1503 [Auxenochlorella protothecoides]|uniref:Uncharacterized protein n=1 Tax=Auxenochlorella protothecoides TaxID=3075 RepID=A0A087SJI5_AUXPR|nr:hypothetical protein F751_1503 [Auxenochlorella protothecoides]KFM25889.1 hypothetical protein F751_1503 [Auxenochlorella protothecoides]